MWIRCEVLREEIVELTCIYTSTRTVRSCPSISSPTLESSRRPLVAAELVRFCESSLIVVCVISNTNKCPDNRLLTPFSYQAEERTFWQAPHVYLKNSPFTHADKIEAPLLLIHGNDDPNPGTHVFQTERLFAAMQGLGKRVRMVILPCERHSYDAMESVLHVVAEQDAFLHKYVVEAASSQSEDPQRKGDREEDRNKRAKI